MPRTNRAEESQARLRFFDCSFSNFGPPGSGRGAIFQAGDFGQQCCGFVLQGRFYRLKICVGNFAGLVFEIQVAKVFIDGVFALAQIRGARFHRTQVELFWQIKDVEQRRNKEQNADASFESHTSVSFSAWSRNCSSSAPRIGCRPPAMAGAGRFFQDRTTITTAKSPTKRAQNGTTHAAMFTAPVVGGAARTV